MSHNLRLNRSISSRRSAIEPAIEHLKMERCLGQNALKGVLTDAFHAVLHNAGHNLRLVISKLLRYT